MAGQADHNARTFPVQKFFALVFSFPWCFSCCEIPRSFRVCSAYFPGFLRVRKVRKILGVFDISLIFAKRPKKRRSLGVKFPGPFLAGNCAEKPICCQFEAGDSEDLHRQGEKIAENRTSTDVNRLYFGIWGRFSAANRQRGRFPAKKGQGILRIWNENFQEPSENTHVHSGPLSRLNAILSLLQPWIRCRTPSAIGSAFWEAYISNRVGVLNCLVLNRSGGSTVR